MIKSSAHADKARPASEPVQLRDEPVQSGGHPVRMLSRLLSLVLLFTLLLMFATPRSVQANIQATGTGGGVQSMSVSESSVRGSDRVNSVTALAGSLQSAEASSEELIDERSGSDRPHILFLTSEDPDNYEAHITIPRFARSEERRV